MIRNRLLWILLISVIIAGIAGYQWLQPKQPNDEDKNIVTVTLGDIEDNVTAQGKLEPNVEILHRILV